MLTFILSSPKRPHVARDVRIYRRVGINKKDLSQLQLIRGMVRTLVLEHLDLTVMRAAQTQDTEPQAKEYREKEIQTEFH